MNDIQDIRDEFLKQRVEVKTMMAELLDEFMRPDKVLELGLLMRSMTPQAANMLDPAVREKIEEVLNGKGSAV